MSHGYLGADVSPDQRWIRVEFVDAKLGDALTVDFEESVRLFGRFEIPLGRKREVMLVEDVSERTGEVYVSRGRLGTIARNLNEGLVVGVHPQG